MQFHVKCSYISMGFVLKNHSTGLPTNPQQVMFHGFRNGRIGQKNGSSHWGYTCQRNLMQFQNYRIISLIKRHSKVMIRIILIRLKSKSVFMQEILYDHRNFIYIGGRSVVGNLRFADNTDLMEGSNIALKHCVG